MYCSNEEYLKRLEIEKMERMLTAKMQGRLPIRGCNPPNPPPLPHQVSNIISPLENRPLSIHTFSLLPGSTNPQEQQPVPPPVPQVANSMSTIQRPPDSVAVIPELVTKSTICPSFCQRMNCFPNNSVYPSGFGGKFTKNKRRRLHSSHKKVRAKKSKNNKHKRSSKRHKRYTHKH
jgi:hypothetical protein